MLALTAAVLLAPKFDVSPVRAMISRYLPQYANRLVLEPIPPTSGRPVFEVSGHGLNIFLRGSDGVALASAFSWYLRHVDNGQVSRRGDQIPWRVIRPIETIRKVLPYRMVNFLNYCTFCYTAAFWDWKQWEREIDLEAMSGVRNPLMIVGNEIVWERVLQRLNYSREDIQKFIPGCAFTAWWLMGNQEGEGGPVPESLIQKESELAKKILARMRSYGMEPVLQGFNGVVPTTLPHYLPGANIVDQGKWAGGYQRPSVLSPLDPQFGRIAQMWYEEHAKLYGKAKYYGGDLFHEGGRTAGLDLAECAKAVQREMRRDNPDATWVLQGWSGNPPKALLNATDPDHVKVQYIESYPQKATVQNYSDRPWSFTFVNTFGGHETLGGSLTALAKLPGNLLRGDNHHNVGIGILDEGLDTNPAVYDLFSDVVWESKDIDLGKWEREYARRRYGMVEPDAEKYWAIMGTDLLGHQAENLLCARPRWGITSTSSWGDTTLTHDLGKMVEAAKALFACESWFSKEPTYQSDCTETMRQLFNDYGVQLYEQMSEAYARKDAKAFSRISMEFLQVLESCDQLFSSNEYTLLGKWISDARKKGETKEEKDLMERNARQLITLWTPTQTDLSDYAYRQWGGLFCDYYTKRWRVFVGLAQASLANNKPMSALGDAEAWEKWVRSSQPVYPSKPSTPSCASLLWRIYKAKFESGVQYWKRQRAEAKRWSWSLASASTKDQVFSWDVTEKVQTVGNGKISVVVEYQAGNNAIVITSAELVKKTQMAVNGKVISQDHHSGRSGLVTKDNVYSLDPGTVDPKAQYLLVLHVSGDGGSDSRGRIVITH